VSHDRYFVERLATKIVEVGNGTALVYPGTYKEFLWHKEHPDVVAEAPLKRRPTDAGSTTAARTATAAPGAAADRGVPVGRDATGGRGAAAGRGAAPAPADSRATGPSPVPREERKRLDAEARKKSRAEQARKAQVDALEARIAETEAAIRELETRMAAPGFYDDRAAAQKAADEHQALMWKVGELMQKWENLQTDSDLAATAD